MDRIVNVLDFLKDEISDIDNRNAISCRYYETFCDEDDIAATAYRNRGMSHDDIRRHMITRMGIAILDLIEQLCSADSHSDDNDRKIFIIENGYDIDYVKNPAPYDGSDDIVPVPVQRYFTRLVRYDDIDNIPVFLKNTPHAKTAEDVNVLFGFRTYTPKFVNIERLLGYDIAVPTFFNPEQEWDFVCALIRELTVFGWDVEDAEKSKRDIVAYAIQREIAGKTPNTADYDEHDTSDVNDAPTDWLNTSSTSSEVACRDKLIKDGVYVMMYNKNLDTYEWLYNLITLTRSENGVSNYDQKEKTPQ